MAISNLARFAVVAAFGLLVAPFAGNAATVTETIYFDDAANNGSSSFTTASGDYFLTPTNFQSSSLCAEPFGGGSGNGKCLIEKGQGVVTTLTRTDGSAFSLASFYFLLTGNGRGSENAITVTGSNAASSTFYLGGTFGNVTKELGGAAGSLVKNDGYVASFLATPYDIFKNVTYVTWTAATSAQIRLDDIAVSRDVADPSPVPLPAAGWLMMAGLGGLGALRARKRA